MLSRAATGGLLTSKDVTRALLYALSSLWLRAALAMRVISCRCTFLNQ